MKNKPASILLILCLLSGALLAGQDVTAPEPPAPPAEEKELSRYTTNWLKDEAKMWSAPFRLDAKGFLAYSAVLAATAILIANDEKIYESFKTFQGRHSWVDKASPAFSLLGDWGVDCGVAGLFFLGGLIARDEKARNTGLMAWETLLHTGFLVQVVKHLAGRQRPSIENGKDYWYGPAGFSKRYSDGNFSQYDSFFSGHTVSAWSLATVIATNYRDRAWVPPVCYGLATLVGLSRLTEDAHWLSDVFLGAVVGYAVGRMVVRNQNKRLQIAPALSPAGVGLSLSYEVR